MDRSEAGSGLVRAPGAWKRQLAELRSVDERSLALFRIGLAIVVLWDLAARAADLTTFYSDLGVIPRSLAAATYAPDPEIFFLYFFAGSPAWAAFLFALTAVSAIALLAGYRTSWAAAATAFLVFCLHARAPSVTHGGDDLLRLLLIWAIVLPLASYFSLGPARRSGGAARHHRVAGAAALIHLTALFWFVPLAGGRGMQSFLAPTALAEALQLDALATSWGEVIRGFPSAVAFADLAIGLLLLVAPLLLWLPALRGLVRFVAVLCLVQVLILGIAPALALGIQPWVAAIAMALFLPRWFWSQFMERTSPHAASERSAASRGGIRTWVALLVLVIVLPGVLQPVLTGRSRAFGSGALTWIDPLGIGPPRSLLLPRKLPDSGALVVRGSLEDGRQIDIVPGSVRKDNSRWGRHLAHLISSSSADEQRAYLDLACREWNAVMNPKAVAVELVLRLERRDVDGGERTSVPVPLLAVACPQTDTEGQKRR